MGGVFLKIMAWYIIGILCGYEATKVFEIHEDYSGLADIILEPVTFLQGAIFFFVSFMVLSYVIQERCVFFLNRVRHTKKGILNVIVFDLVSLVLGWGFLFYCSPWVTFIILCLTLIHLGLSYDKIQNKLS